MRLSFAKAGAVRAIDTNIVVRIITNDDPEQVTRARAVLDKGEIFLPLTVCLESEWVLRTSYALSKEVIADSIVKFSGVEGVEVENPQALTQAIAWLREGMDFADALHLASAEGCEDMLSFDTKLAKAAKRCGAMSVIAP